MRLIAAKLKSVLLLAFILTAIFYLAKNQLEHYLLNKIIARLSADSRVAEVVVTQVKPDVKTKKIYTTIKFLEYDVQLNPLEPKYFTFSGNVIQFQSMVVRFDDFYVKKGHPLKGKSAYLFMKVFRLTEQGVESFDIVKVSEIPSGYDLPSVRNNFEKKIWQKFWEYALNPAKAAKLGIKNVQIEAPGTKFIPGIIYTIKIEHDGGLRIDTQPIAPILKN